MNRAVSFWYALVACTICVSMIACAPSKYGKTGGRKSVGPSSSRSISNVQPQVYQGPLRSVIVHVQHIEIDYINIDTDMIDTLIVQPGLGCVDLLELYKGIPITIPGVGLPPSVPIVAGRLIITPNQDTVVRTEQGLCRWIEGETLTQIPILMPNLDPDDVFISGRSYLFQIEFDALNLQIENHVAGLMQKTFDERYAEAIAFLEHISVISKTPLIADAELRSVLDDSLADLVDEEGIERGIAGGKGHKGHKGHGEKCEKYKDEAHHYKEKYKKYKHKYEEYKEKYKKYKDKYAHYKEKYYHYKEKYERIKKELYQCRADLEECKNNSGPGECPGEDDITCSFTPELVLVETGPLNDFCGDLRDQF